MDLSLFAYSLRFVTKPDVVGESVNDLAVLGWDVGREGQDITVAFVLAEQKELAIVHERDRIVHVNSWATGQLLLIRRRDLKLTTSRWTPRGGR